MAASIDDAAGVGGGNASSSYSREWGDWTIHNSISSSSSSSNNNSALGISAVSSGDYVDRHLQQQQQQQQGDVMGMIHLAGDWSNDSTSDDDPYSNVPYLRQLVLASFLATFVIGLLGNSLVIFVVCSFADVRRKSVANYYILSLAIADWCFVLFLPLYAVATFTHSWQFGTVLCKLATGVREANRYASIFTLVALSVDRYIASFPDLRSWRRAAVGQAVCGAVWCQCAVVIIPYITFSTVYSGNRVQLSCHVKWPAAEDDALAVETYVANVEFVVAFVVPLLIIVTSYALLAHRVLHLRLAANRRRLERQMTRTVTVVVIVFVVCHLPYYVVQQVAQRQRRRVADLGSSFTPTSSEVTAFAYANAIAQILVFVGSCSNPIIYGLSNRNYRVLYQNAVSWWPTEGLSIRSLTSRTARRRLPNDDVIAMAAIDELMAGNCNPIGGTASTRVDDDPQRANQIGDELRRASNKTSRDNLIELCVLTT